MADASATHSVVALTLLKSSLGYFDSNLEPAVESYLQDLLVYARKALQEECKIMLIPGDLYDDQLLAMYADYLYRKRATGVPKPDMLKDAIRNRQVRNALVSPQEGADAGA